MAKGRDPRPFRYEWDGVLRRLALPPTVKLVAAYASQYADLDGRHVRPGVSRLATETGYDERTIRRSLARLRELGLMVRVRSGSAQGRRGQADEYRLVVPDDILDRVGLVQPVVVPMPETRESKPVDNSGHRAPNTGHQSPVIPHRTPDSGVRSSPGTPDIGRTEHRTPVSAHQPVTTPANTPTAQNSGSARTTGHLRAVDNSARCPHGNTNRRRRDGTARCTECAAAAHPSAAQGA